MQEGLELQMSNHLYVYVEVDNLRRLLGYELVVKRDAQTPMFISCVIHATLALVVHPSRQVRSTFTYNG